MTILLDHGTDAAAPRPQDMWRMRPARDVRAGWTLQLNDGRTVTVVGNAIPLVRMGKVAIPFEAPGAWSVPDAEPEFVHPYGWRLVPCRTPLEEAAYVQAVNDMAALDAAREGTQ